MGTCPKCGRKIEYLLCYTTEDNTYYFDDQDYTITERHVSDMEFVCPECRRTLAREEEEADVLLKK